VLMAMPAVTRIIAPHLWGWLADHSARRVMVVKLTGLAGTICFLGVFLGSGFWLLCVVVFVMTFFWSAALPLVEATTLSHLGEETGRYGHIRVWGSIGFIVAVVVVGHALDWVAVSAVLWVILFLMICMLGSCWHIPETVPHPHAQVEPTILHILRRPEVIALIVASALMAVAHGPYYTFYSLHIVNHGYSKAVTGWLWALGVICEIGIFVWMPRLYRAFTLRGILIVSFMLAAMRFLMIGWFADSLALLLLAQTLHAASFGSFHAAAIGMVHKLFRGRNQARGQAIYGSLSFGVGGVIGGLASGYAWEGLGPELTFTLGAGSAFAGGLVLLLFTRAAR